MDRSFQSEMGKTEKICYAIMASSVLIVSLLQQLSRKTCSRTFGNRNCSCKECIRQHHQKYAKMLTKSRTLKQKVTPIPMDPALRTCTNDAGGTCPGTRDAYGSQIKMLSSYLLQCKNKWKTASADILKASQENKKYVNFRFFPLYSDSRVRFSFK